MPNAAIEPIFHPGYRALPTQFYAPVDLGPAPAPQLIHYNQELGEQLGLNADWARSARGAQMLSCGPFPKTSVPIATAYGGHQFGQWAGLLGDGRATILGDLIDHDDQPWEIQLKGSGQTPYSRGGDGRATLGSVVREYIHSEAMHALGVPTTRALAVCLTGDDVHRPDPNTGQMIAHKGAVLTRVAPSHIRVGTFQYFYAMNEIDSVRALADYTIDRHYPHLTSQSKYPSRYLALLDEMATKTARLVTHWMSLGFIHGVMNTDNTHIGGLTIDYGPCAFMDVFDPQKTFSSIDRNQRYSWGNQAKIAEWNVNRFAQCLMPLLKEEGMAEEQVMSIFATILDHMAEVLEHSFQDKMYQKLGISSVTDADDHNRPEAKNLVQFLGETMNMLAESGLHYTSFFIKLTALARDEIAPEIFLDQFGALSSDNRIRGAHWLEQWQITRAARLDDTDARASAEHMAQTNPLYVAHNHLVENAISQAGQGDFTVFNQLVTALKTPFTPQQGMEHLQENPTSEQRVGATYCGT